MSSPTCIALTIALKVLFRALNDSIAPRSAPPAAAESAATPASSGGAAERCQLGVERFRLRRDVTLSSGRLGKRRAGPGHFLVASVAVLHPLIRQRRQHVLRFQRAQNRRALSDT